MNEWTSILVNYGGIGLVLWWMTQTLVPQLQKERSEAIKAFQDEMQKERELHAAIVDKIFKMVGAGSS